MLYLVIQLCLTLCNLMDYSLPGSSVHRDSPGKNPGVDFHALLRGIFPNQRSNMGLPHCRQILYHVSHQGSPRILEGSLYLLKGIFPTQELNQDLLHCRRILSQLSYERSPSQVNTLLNILPPLLKLVDVGIGCSLELILVLITW